MSSNNNIIDIDSYINNLEQMLTKLREEISSITKPTMGINNEEMLTELDNYIYEVNKFYYKSFHEQFFPEYSKKLKEDFSMILKVSRQEDMLKKDIIASIKRYARLFNQVKTLIALIDGLRRENNMQLLSVTNENDYRTLELLYTLKEIRENLQLLFTFTENLSSVAKNKDLLKVAHEYPGYLSALKLISSLDTTDPCISQALNKLCIHLQYMQNLLTKLQTIKQDYSLAAHNIILAIEEDMLLFTTINLPDKLLNFYNRNISSQISVYLQLIKFYIDTNNIERVNELALAYEQCLFRWLIMLEESHTMALNNIELYTSVVGLAETGEEYLNELHKDVYSALESLEEIIDELASTSNADFSYFSTKTVDMLNFAVPLFKAINTEQEISYIGPLDTQINRVTQGLSFLKIKIDFLNEKSAYSSSLSKTFSSINNILDSYLQLLGNIKSDLERLLAPHNISRIWKDINIRIDRILLTKGDLFPVNYLYLIDKYGIETHISEDISNTVLHEEGDIFIIRVDDDVEEEIPYLVLSEEG